MWQPNRAQWWIVWTAAALLILAWPPDRGRPLALTAARWLADPFDALPSLPAPLPIGLDDDGDVVAAHDAQENDYYRVWSGSAATRWRMRLKAAESPFETSTLRQLLAGAAVLSAFAVWRLNAAGLKSER